MHIRQHPSTAEIPAFAGMTPGTGLSSLRCRRVTDLHIPGTLLDTLHPSWIHDEPGG